MSSELLGAAQNVLKGNLGGAWDINKGYADAYTDLGIARRFGGAAAAYSLRDIGAMNGSVVNVRREPEDTTAAIDDEERFSANQVQDGTLERWVNGKLENTLPADVATAAAAYSLRKVKDSYSGNAVRVRRSSDDIEVNVAFDSDDKVSASSTITNVAEQGGESGQTTDTTLGDFISGTDAFVHTWYDQAGSNDAVQATAANQPKIASSGTLLSSLDYSDGGKFLQLSSTVSVGEDVSLFGVATKSTGTDILFDARTAAGAGFRVFEQSSVQKFNYDATTVSSSFNPSAGNNFLITAIQDGSNAKIGINANTFDTASETTVESVTPIPVIGGKSFTTVGADNWEGTISEIIYYTSDQTDNRFKIESNINNYYGLYNDANDLTQTEWQNDGTEGTFTSTSTDGFTYQNSSSTAFIGVTLTETLALNDSVFVSFNATGVTHPDSSDQSPQIRLRDGVGSGSSGTSAINQVINGFNSFTLTYNTGSNGQHIVFSEGDTGGGTVTISDFKVSRIARNGFVETWYDQSGNGKDITQGTAGDQPAIVRNGGQVKSENSLPSISFADDAVTLERTEFLTGQLSAYFFVFDAESGDSTQAQVILRQGSDFRIGAAVETNGKVRANIRDDGPDSIFLDAGGDLATGGTLLQSIFIRARGANGMYNYVDGANEKVGDSTDIQDVDFSSVDSGDFSIGGNAGGAFDFKGEIQEAIFFESDLFTDKSTIETELNNHYNVF